MQTQEWCVQYHLNTILGRGKCKSTKESFSCIISKSTKSSSSRSGSIEKNQKRRTQCNDLNIWTTPPLLQNFSFSSWLKSILTLQQQQQRALCSLYEILYFSLVTPWSEFTSVCNSSQLFYLCVSKSQLPPHISALTLGRIFLVHKRGVFWGGPRGGLFPYRLSLPTSTYPLSIDIPWHL